MSQNANVRPSELAAVLDVVSPISQTVGSVSTGWIDASQYAQLLAVVQSGVLGGGGTLDAKFQQATDSSGTGAKDVTNAAITQITANNKQALINLRPEALDLANSFNYVRLTLTVGTATSLVSAIVQGFAGRYGAVQGTNVA